MKLKLTSKTISLVLTGLFCLFVLPINERIYFTTTNLSNQQLLTSYLLKAGFAVFLYFIILFIINFIKKIREKDEFYLSWLNFSNLYFAIMVVFFFLIYPGHWVWDEFVILDNVRVYSNDAWHNYFTNIYYTFCLYLIPSAIGIVLLQLLTISAIVGYILSRVKKMVTKKNLVYLFLFLFLLPPIVLNNFCPFRLVMYSYLELILIFKLISLFIYKIRDEDSIKEFLIFTALISVVSFWRTEAIFYLLLLPFLAFYLKIFSKNIFGSLKSSFMILLSVMIILGSFTIVKVTQDKKYFLSGFLNPLAMLVTEDNDVKNDKETIELVNKVLKPEIIERERTYHHINYLDSAITSEYQESLKELGKAYPKIVLANFDTFLNYRWLTFVATNSLDASFNPLPNSIMSMKFIENRYIERREAVLERYYENDPFLKPINQVVKAGVTKRLMGLDSQNNFTLYRKIVWNVMPIVVLLTAALIYSVVRKKYLWSIIITLGLFKALVIFITTPAAYFLYYFPLYLSGYFLIIFLFVAYLERDKNKKKVKEALFS